MVLRETLPARLETAELIHLTAALDGVDALMRGGTTGRPARTAPPALGVAQWTLYKVAAG